MDSNRPGAIIAQLDSSSVFLWLAGGLRQVTITEPDLTDLDMVEDLQAFATIMLHELAEFGWSHGDDWAYKAALTTNRVRSMARRVLLRMSRFSDTGKRPSVRDLQRGLVLANGEPNMEIMWKLADMLFRVYSRYIDETKRRPAAVVA